MLRSWRRVSAVVTTLATVALVVGVGGPRVLAALGALDAVTVVAALALGLVTTAAGALRWLVLARRVGVALTPGMALARCYEAQFLNLTLPGGVLGDARRAADPARPVTARGVGAVVLERSVGQVVLVATTLAAPLLVPGLPRPGVATVVVLAGVAVVVAGVVLGVLRTRWRPVLAELGRAVLDPRAGPVAVACSLVVVAGLVVTFGLAARTAGVVAEPAVLVGLALTALLAMAVPVGVAGWGPREAAVAAGFAATGLGAGAGVATAATYGVLTLAAAVPGGVLVLVRRAVSGPAAGRRRRAVPPAARARCPVVPHRGRAG